MKVIVKTISTVHNPQRLRTKTFTGHVASEPKIGEKLVVVGRGLSDRTKSRFFTTSRINAIRYISPISTDYHTQNSVYRVTLVYATKVKPRS